MHRTVVLGSLLVATSAAAEPRVTQHSDFELGPTKVKVKRVAIDNPLGDIIIEGHDRPTVQISTDKAAPDADALDRLHVSVVPDPDGTVRIALTADRDPERKTVARGAVRIDIRVKVPRDARIDASSSTGTLRLSNVDAGGELDSGSGRIEVKNVAGELSTSSISGATTIEQAFGAIDSQAIAADLRFDSITGDRLVAAASRGAISGRRVRSRDIQLTTTEGTIRLEAEATLRGRLVVASLGGDIAVRLRRSEQPLLVRARGGSVQLGGTAIAPRADGWVEQRVGAATTKALPMLVELRSKRGNVQLVFVD